MFLGIGLAILYIVYLRNNAAYIEECAFNNIPAADCNLIKKIVDDMKSANYKWVFAALSFFMVSNYSRAVRWNMLLEPLGYKPKFFNSFGLLMVGYLANLGIPRSGEFLKAGMMAQYEDYEPEKVMGTIVTDRILDVMSLGIVILLTLVLSFNNFVGYFRENANLEDKFGHIFTLSNFMILTVLGLSMLYILWRNRIRITQSGIGQRVVKVLKGFWEGIITIKEVKKPILFIFHSVVIWVCYYLMTYLMFFSFIPTQDLPAVSGLVVFAFGTLGIVVPTPGGMGSYQYLISEALQLYGVSLGDSFSFANIMFFSVQIFCNILFGLIAFIVLPILNRK